MTGPTIVDLEVVPVAGHDSMLLNLSGAHGPFFTRSIVIATDSDGREILGAVPGGEPIRAPLAESADLVVGRPIAQRRMRCTASMVPAPGATPRRSSIWCRGRCSTRSAPAWRGGRRVRGAVMAAPPTAQNALQVAS